MAKSLTDELLAGKPQPHPEIEGRYANGHVMPGHTGFEIADEETLRKRLKLATRVKSSMKKVLASMEEQFPSDKFGIYLKVVWDMACEERNPKAALDVLSFIMAYQHGKPVERQLNVSSTLDQFRAVFGNGEVEGVGDESEGDDSADVIEAHGRVVGKVGVDVD